MSLPFDVSLSPGRSHSTKFTFTEYAINARGYFSNDVYGLRGHYERYLLLEKKKGSNDLLYPWGGNRALIRTLFNYGYFFKDSIIEKGYDTLFATVLATN